MVKVENRIKFTRVWAMPNKWTFLIEPIAYLLGRYVGDGKGWVDPFAGENSPAEITNDLNTERPTQFHMDALDFLMSRKDSSCRGILFDPPYSFTQAKECYDDYGKDLFVEHDNIPTKMDYWANCKSTIGTKVKNNGVVICFGWNSNGIGRNRGFEMLEILLVNHGGSKNDTIVTVEKKIQSSLF